MRKKKNEKNSIFFVEREEPSESDSNTLFLKREVEKVPHEVRIISDPLNRFGIIPVNFDPSLP
jgi:hypothetical protein